MQTYPDRLAAAVLARRTELDVTQLDVWQAGGPSNTTLTKIEAGEMPTLSRTTAKKLDHGMRWEPGSSRRVFDQGGEPNPILRPGMTGKASAQLRRQIDMSGEIDDETRAALIRLLDQQERGAG